MMNTELLNLELERLHKQLESTLDETKEDRLLTLIEGLHKVLTTTYIKMGVGD